MDIKSKTLTFHEARRPWDEWGIRETLGSVNPSWRNCTPSDIDSVIELNGYFLFIEDKPGSVLDDLPAGQLRMYKNLISLSDKISVWFIYGSKDNPEWLYSVRSNNFEAVEHPDQIMKRIGEWAEFVNHKLKGAQ